MSLNEMGKNRRVYRHMLQTYGKSWYVRASFFIQFLTRLCKLIALPVAVSQIIANLSNSNFEGAKVAVLVYIVFSLTLGLLTPFAKYLALKGENPIYSKVIQNYTDKLLQVDLDYFNDNLSGYLTTAARQYSDGLLVLLRVMRDRYMGILLAVVFPVCVIFWIDKTLGALVLVLSILLATYLLWASKIVAPYRTKAREYYKQTSGYIADAVSNILAVKASSHEANVSIKTGKLMKKEATIFMRRYKVQTKMILFREFITVSFLGLLFWLTVARVNAGAFDIAGAVLITAYALTILTAIYEVSDALDEHDDLVDKILPGFEVLNRENRVKDPQKPIKFGKATGKIEFQDVEFAYVEKDGSSVVFNGFNLTIPAGQKLGVVGVSGAGKSTLTKLLLRFNDVSNGSITIDGIDIRQVQQVLLRKNIAYVPQEPLLFHTSIKENILLTRPEASSKQIDQALKAAHAYDFIQKLPNKLESVVGERGIKLSGGQKQRIAIARAVLQDAPIIVLDEATSALDSESEQIIKDSFSEILKNKTAIVVAHRLSTLSEMDRIILIENGVVVEDGSHKSLVRNNGAYAKLWRRQQMHKED